MLVDAGQGFRGFRTDEVTPTPKLRSNRMRSAWAGANQNFENEERICQRFVSRDLVFRWTVLAQG